MQLKHYDVFIYVEVEKYKILAGIVGNIFPNLPLVFVHKSQLHP